jgi:hypothetical protein
MPFNMIIALKNNTFYVSYPKLLSKEPNPERSDARDDDSSNTAGINKVIYQINILFP